MIAAANALRTTRHGTIAHTVGFTSTVTVCGTTAMFTDTSHGAATPIRTTSLASPVGASMIFATP
jgi:hypothetical protein